MIGIGGWRVTRDGVSRALPPAVYCAIRGGGSVASRGAIALRADAFIVECDCTCLFAIGGIGLGVEPEGRVCARSCIALWGGVLFVLARTRDGSAVLGRPSTWRKGTPTGEAEVEEDARRGCEEPRREMWEGESSPESLLWSNEWCPRTSSFVSALEPRSMDRADLW